MTVSVHTEPPVQLPVQFLADRIYFTCTKNALQTPGQHVASGDNFRVHFKTMLMLQTNVLRRGGKGDSCGKKYLSMMLIIRQF